MKRNPEDKKQNGQSTPQAAPADLMQLQDPNNTGKSSIQNLPREMLHGIFKFLTICDFRMVAAVCQLFNNVTKSGAPNESLAYHILKLAPNFFLADPHRVSTRKDLMNLTHTPQYIKSEVERLAMRPHKSKDAPHTMVVVGNDLQTKSQLLEGLRVKGKERPFFCSDRQFTIDEAQNLSSTKAFAFADVIVIAPTSADELQATVSSVTQASISANATLICYVVAGPESEDDDMETRTFEVDELAYKLGIVKMLIPVPEGLMPAYTHAPTSVPIYYEGHPVPIPEWLIAAPTGLTRHYCRR